MLIFKLNNNFIRLVFRSSVQSTIRIQKMSAKRNIQIIYKEIPQGFPDASKTFEIKKGTIVLEDVVLKTDEVLVRTLYASVDPYMRFRMHDPSIKSYFDALIPGDIMTGGTVYEVIKTNNPNFGVGDVVAGFSKWAEYSVISKEISHGRPIKKIPNGKNSPVPLSYFLGVLGMPGLTAYVGLHKICEPLTPGQTLYVSAASGAVGQVVGQYAKALGLRVVGSAGDDEKVEYLIKELGFDAAFNYKKHEDFNAILKQTCPDGIDIYFENVGGKMLDAVIQNCNSFARIPICGMISQYNRPSDQEPIYNLVIAILKRLRLEGFIVNDESARYRAEFTETFTKLIKEGKIKYKETITNGIESLPDALVGLFHGKNFGKASVKIADL